MLDVYVRNHQAIVQPRLYDCLMVTQITLHPSSSKEFMSSAVMTDMKKLEVETLVSGQSRLQAPFGAPFAGGSEQAGPASLQATVFNEDASLSVGPGGLRARAGTVGCRVPQLLVVRSSRWQLPAWRRWPSRWPAPGALECICQTPGASRKGNLGGRQLVHTHSPDAVTG